MSNLWDLALVQLKHRIASEDIDEWLTPTRMMKVNEQELVVHVPQSIFIDWIQDNYLDEIHRALEELGHESLRVRFVESEEHKVAAVEKKTLAPRDGLRINPKYRFESFVIGPSNQFAHAAARAVADAPSTSYNPLYVYGASGLGKTHLLHAIGHQLQATQPKLKICYTTCEEFTNQFINSIRFNKGEAFRDRYRSVDVLLIDDIQFLSGKTQTQEEFFHTFNALFEQQKQIILSSDCGPSHIPKLEARLKSRFQWGLSADIQAPPLETRIAILRKKAEAECIELPDDVLLYIGSKIKTNVRELEGALIKVIAYGSLSQRVITLELAEQCLRGVIKEENQSLSCERIQRLVAEQFNLTTKELCSRNNSKRVSQPRQIAMYLTRKLTAMSLPEIGHAFGNKHHSTVLYSIQKIEKNMTADPDTLRLVNGLKKSLL